MCPLLYTRSKALDEVEEIGRKPENWALYISRKKAILDEVSREASYRERSEELEKRSEELEKREKQLEEVQKQVEVAQKQGLEQAKIELIQRMLVKKLSPEEITNLTDIPLEDIKKIAESIH